MIELYTIPGTAGLAPHMALEEAGADYTMIRLRRDDRGNVIDPPNYREINPHDRIPAMRVDGKLLTEQAAMVMWVSDAYPEAGLAPEVGSWERAHWYRWLVYLTNTIQIAHVRYFLPHRFTSDDTTDAVRAFAAAELVQLRDSLDAELGEGPYVLGDRFSSADLALANMTRWGRRLEPKWWDAPNLGAHYERIKSRPAIQRVYAQEELDDDVY
ncbi:MAG: glutathione S-transferase family protein [Thermoleophilia bacterium]